MRDEPNASDDLRLRVPAAAAEVAGIRAAVDAFAEVRGIATEQRQDIALAVTEACANVVMHAYVHAPAPGPLTVEAYRENGEFVVTVSDEGSGMAPRRDSSGLGLGLALIARLAQRLELGKNAPAGARLTMAFTAARP